MATTISDDQKKNATEALGAVRAFHKAQDTWNRLNTIKAPEDLLGPAWAELGTTRKAMFDSLLVDFGEQTEKLNGSLKVLAVGCRGQFIDRKLLSFDDQLIFTEALRSMESELRKIAGIKERSFAELIAEKVAQRQTGKVKQSDWKPPDGYAPAKAVYTDEGKRVPRTTVQQWIEQDKPDKKQDPDTHAVYVPKKWLKGRLHKYCPRDRN